MDPALFTVTAIVIFVATLLQTAVGFGAGLAAVPVLLFLGWSLPEAIVVLVASLGAQVAWGAWRLRAQTPWRAVLPVALLRLAFFPLGLALLGMLVGLGEGRVKQVVGVVILLALAAQWLAKIEPRDRVHPGWGVATAASSGVLAGLVGMGGPPLVLWVMAHRWPPDRARAAMWSTFTIGLPVFVAMLAWQFGDAVLDAAIAGVASIPATFLGYAAGRSLTREWSTARMRFAMAATLAVIALGAVVEPMLA